MEGLGAAASVTALLQITAEVGKLCGKYMQEVRHAQKDIERLQSKVSALHEVLTRIHNESHSDMPTATVQKCLEELRSIKERLEPKHRHIAMNRMGLRSLKWPFTSKEVGAQVQELEEYLVIFSTILQLNIHEKVSGAEQELLLEKLPYAGDAVFNSHLNDQRHRPCLANTRVDVLGEVMAWAADPSPQCIFWLKGLAGMGKSTIATTVAFELKKKSRPVASYFFQRGHSDLAHVRKLIPTIVRQLSQYSSSYRQSVITAIKKEPGIGDTASLQEQYDKLLVKPLGKLAPLIRAQDPFFIVMDALDECDVQRDLRMLLKLLAGTDDMPELGLKVFVTSRPELPIRHGFQLMPSILYRNLALQNVPRSVVDSDIRKYLSYELKDVQHDFCLPAHWPATEDLDILARKAGGLFIFAATACRYIGGSSLAKPPDRLQQICTSVATNTLMTEELDQMYAIVLQSSIRGKYTEEERQSIRNRYHYIVGCIIMLLDPIPISQLYSLLNGPLVESQEELEGALQTLHAVFDVPEATGSPIQMLHLSFRDFLLDPNRCLDRQFWVDEQQAHRSLTTDCIRLLSSSLSRNMCGLPSLGTLKSEIHPATIENALSPAVHWPVDSASFLPNGKLLATTYYVTESGEEIDDEQDVQRLEIWDPQTGASQAYLKPPTGSFVIEKLSPDGHNVVSVSFDGILRLWDTAKAEYRFISGNHASTIISAAFSFDSQFLALGSEDGSIRLLDVQKGDWHYKLEGRSEQVEALIFSPDGTMIAATIADETVQLWDFQTSSHRFTTEGPPWKAAGFRDNQVVFSPHSKLLASQSGDIIIRLLDVVTGKCRFKFECYSGYIRIVTFSPDGELLALASNNDTVQLWDVQTGSCRFILTGHIMAFSPDGRFLALGSTDCLVRLWSVQEQEYHSILDYHSEEVDAVCFSPDGRFLVSASNRMARFWDVHLCVYRPSPYFDSRRETMYKVRFSPDGKLVASESRNKIQLWDPETGDCCFDYEGNGVSFSSDGQLVVSVSEEGVRLLNIRTGNHRMFRKGYLAVLSPRGQLAASAMTDYSIQLWNIENGDNLATFKGHSEKITSLVFSASGNFIASGVDPCRPVDSCWLARLWNTLTGDCIATFADCFDTMVFAPNSELLAVVFFDHSLRFWDTRAGLFSFRLRDNYGAVFSPNSRLVATRDLNKEVHLWDTQTGEHLLTIPYLSIEPRIEFLAGIDAVFVDGIAHEVGPAKMTEAERANHRHLLSDLQVHSSWKWVTKSGERLLWLPSERRPFACNSLGNYAVWKNKIVIGSGNGIMTFLTFEDEFYRHGGDFQEREDKLT
ncbi:MAG: hypothetical protein Q9225_001883 [Loekoesia sp. 1 TL-2023]